MKSCKNCKHNDGNMIVEDMNSRCWGCLHSNIAEDVFLPLWESADKPQEDDDQAQCMYCEHWNGFHGCRGIAACNFHKFMAKWNGFCEDMSPVNGGERPPIGIKPRYINDEERKQEIMDAMVRYSNAFKPIPVEWLDELRDLIDYTGAKYHD